MADVVGDRSRHHVALTDAGRAFLREMKDILERALRCPDALTLHSAQRQRQTRIAARSGTVCPRQDTSLVWS